jgi:hypothetical protein
VRKNQASSKNSFHISPIVQPSSGAMLRLSSLDRHPVGGSAIKNNHESPRGFIADEPRGLRSGTGEVEH